MIIFDYATLADDSHRRHFIDQYSAFNTQKYHTTYDPVDKSKPTYLIHKETGQRWQPDYAAYYAASDKDVGIRSLAIIFNTIRQWTDVQVWVDIPESMKEKVIHWFLNRYPIRPHYWNQESWGYVLKLRPDGDTTPWHQLKEKWIWEYIKKPVLNDGKSMKERNRFEINMAFEPSGSPMIEVWKSYGVTVMEVHS